MSKKIVDEYISKINLNAYELYKNFIKEEKFFNKLCENSISSEASESLKNHTEKLFKVGYVETEDLAPIMYIKYRLAGISEELTIKHAVIDEAQDFSVFQYYVLKNILKDSSFTILGDVCQGIHSHRGIDDWEKVIRQVFYGKCGMITLTKSYRTTVEIMEAANKVIQSLDKGFVKAEPVIRHGETPEIIRLANQDEVVKNIEEKIIQFKKNGYKTIAVICKSEEECGIVHKKLKSKFIDISLVTDKLEEYKGDLVVIPSYLSKGLEFDGVIISNANNEIYGNNELDGKLLYVSMTRALHKLIIFHTKEITNFLR